jgi:NAD(P)-dependent dehydrogenase (short-subunit alcohol dehydrogenase family)
MGEQVVLLTGALAGIGRATALSFARDCASVVASGRRAEDGEALVGTLRALGTTAAFIRADVSDLVTSTRSQTSLSSSRLTVSDLSPVRSSLSTAARLPDK